MLLCVVSVLLFDSNCFLKEPAYTIVTNKTIELSAGNKPTQQGHSTEFIYDDKGNKYKVPLSLYQYFSIGDSFAVTRSVLFNRPIRIQFAWHGEYVRENTGVLNADWFSRVISAIPVVLCLLIIFIGNRINKEERLFIMLFFSVILTAVVVAFFFIF